MIVSADTNLFLYAANSDSPHYESAQKFFEEQSTSGERFLLCGLVLIELYMQLRNPAVFKKPKSGREAAAFCDALRSNPAWEFGDYEPEVMKPLWNWASKSTSGFRHIIDARLAFTLQHHGVTHFATANVAHFKNLGFEKVWSPIAR